MLYFNTNVGATLIRIQIGSRRQGFAFAASRPGRLRADLKGWLFKRERGSEVERTARVLEAWAAAEPSKPESVSIEKRVRPRMAALVPSWPLTAR